VVTDRVVDAGEVVALWRGPILTGSEVGSLSSRERDYLLQVDDDAFMYVALDELRTVDFINHSCSPNCGFIDAVTLVAMRRIEPGETVTFDYAMSDSNDFVRFACRCGTTNCRGELTRDDWKLIELQRRYAGWFAPHIRRLIESRNG
jgi:hypothetical protein